MKSMTLNDRRGRRPAFHYLLFMEEPSEIPPWERGLEDLDTSAVDLDTLISLFKETPPSELGKSSKAFPTSYRSWSAMNQTQRSKASEFWSNLDQSSREALYAANVKRVSHRKKRDTHLKKL